MAGIKKNVKNVKVDVAASLISAVIRGKSDSVRKLVDTHGLSHCECGSGGYVPLFVAIELDHVEIAKFLLERGAKADSETDFIETPLHLASVKGYTELVQLLLEKNVPVDARNDKNETPLHLAVREGYAEIVEILVSNDASLTAQTNEGSTPPLLAAEQRHEEIFQMLLSHACANLKTAAKTRNSTLLLNHILLRNPSSCDKVNKLVVQIVTTDVDQSKIVNELIDHGFILNHKLVNEDLLLAAVKKNYVKLIDSVLKSGANYSPLLLHTAVRDGHKEIVELFLKAGFNADAKDENGETCLCHSLNCCREDISVEVIQLLLANGANIKKAPELLHTAVDEGLIDVCKVLIKNGADVNALNTQNETPLYIAVSTSGKNSAFWEEESKKQIDETIRNNIVKLLLNSGADMTKYINGRTAFHHAVSSGRTEMVSIFLEFGVDVDACDQSDDSPLFLAISNGRPEIIEILCKSNADITLQGAEEMTALKYAVLLQKADVIEMLLKFGAVIDFNIVDACGFVRGNSYEKNVSNFGHMLAFLKKHIIKLKTAGLGVSELNSHLDYNSFSDFKLKCEEEVSRMKIEKVNAQFSVHDILVNGRNPSYAKNKSLIGIENFDFDAFPIYKNQIIGNLEISRSKLELVQSGQWALDVLVKISSKLNGNKYSVLPEEILEEIVSYLSYRDMKSLVYCGKAVKRKVGQ